MATTRHNSDRSNISHGVKMLVALVAAYLAVAWPAPLQLRAAVVNGPMATTTDAPLRYDATGVMFTSEAWTDNSPPPVEGPWYEIPAMAPAPADGLGAYWKFSVRHSAMQFKSGQATKARLWVKGEHLRVPAPGHGEGLNVLAAIGTEAKDVTTTGSLTASVWGGQIHFPHHDFYGVVGTKMKYEVLGANATLGGKTDVLARHSESLPKEFKDWTKTEAGFASVSAASKPFGSLISFDAATNMLMFQPGRVDVLDMQGGFSGGVDPQFAADGLLGANLSISPLHLLGMESDGRYRFSGGMVHVGSPSGVVSLDASFDEYLVGDTSRRDSIDSFAALTRGQASESLEGDMLTFIDAFNNSHVLQKSLDPTNVEDRIMSLTFATAPGLNLAQLTNGFTQSAMFVPADIIIGGMSHVSTPSDHLAGDYNNDGHVDGLDYQVWRGEFDLPGGLADGNGNGITDAADYVVWRKNAGIEPVATLGRLSANAIAVPEPSILFLAAVGLCLTCSGRQLRSAEILKLSDRRCGVVRLESPRASAKSLPESKKA